MIKTNNPVFLTLWRIRFPPVAILSILHRISGFLLTAFLFFLVFFFSFCLVSVDNYNFIMTSFLPNIWIKIILVFCLWAFLHHFCTGIRYFWTDFNIGIKKNTASVSAIILLVVSFLSFVFSLWLIIL
jgi:succinate dehydrogenase / fumarate reductase, cytochrome b subunit